MTDEGRQECEAAHKVSHLPQDVRDAIWRAAHEIGLVRGQGFYNTYKDHAYLALLAFKAGRKQASDYLHKWADDMDNPPWRDGWEEAIRTARVFAQQIEDLGK